MRSLSFCSLALVACAGEAARTEEPNEIPVETPVVETTAVRTFAEPIGDALGSGLDLSDTTVAVDDHGFLVIDVEIPDAERREPATTDNVQVYVDVDRDHEKNGYDVRLVLFGGAARPFAFQRFEGGRWRDRTPPSFEASFAHGVHIRVPAADVGVPESFDFFVASIDEATGKISDLAPDGALWERWSYSR